MKIAYVKNWDKFQHYKNRCPPWIKLSRSLIDDFEFTSLPVASKALAPLLWLLASESDDASVRIDADYLAYRLRWTVDDAIAGLIPLIDKGFIEVASDVLAECLQDAIPERETEGERETEKEARASKPRPKTRKTTIPNGFAISPAVVEWAEKGGHLRLPEHFEAFQLKCTAKGYEYADWDAAFMEAIRKDWAGLKVTTITQPRKRKMLGEGSSTNYGDAA